MFPIQITKLSLRHRGGTKDYHLVLIQRADGVSLLINRWGKAGSWGSMQVARGDANAMKGLWASKEHEKQGSKGYDRTIASNVVSVADEAEFRKVLGLTYLANLGADNFSYLLPDADTTGVRDPEAAEFIKNPNGSFTRKDKERRLVKDPEPTLDDLKANPNWGIF